ncbi:MAG: dienelactone hydrolase family protein [Candidatus Omnitrophica bacterium]|nr:dienelactone hydrolase family protein [Candidatus Omnitrophota bacterium]
MNSRSIQQFIFWSFTLSFVCFLGPSHAKTEVEQLEDSPRHHEWVDVAYGDGETIRCFLIYPEVKEAADSVIVIHENRGLTDWVRLIGDKLAAEGFVAICPDFLTGKGPNGGGTSSFSNSDEARTAIYQLDQNKINEALDAIVPYLRELPSTTDKVSVVGYCWGGGQCFDFATREKSLKSANVFYGRPPEEGYSNIQCPVFGYYGENDNRINATIPETKEKMKEAGKTYDPVIYAGAGHGFLRAGMEDDASEAEKKAVQEAWDRFIAILKK